MKAFDNQNLKTMRAEIVSALEQLEVKYGVSFKLGNISYDSKRFTTSLECIIVNEGETPQQTEWKDNCFRFNLEENWFGKIFMQKGNTYKITGIKRYADRFPVVAENISNGHEYCFPANYVIAYFEQKDISNKKEV